MDLPLHHNVSVSSHQDYHFVDIARKQNVKDNHVSHNVCNWETLTTQSKSSNTQKQMVGSSCRHFAHLDEGTTNVPTAFGPVCDSIRTI